MQFSSFELIKVRYIVFKLLQRSLEQSQNYAAKQLPLIASLTLFILIITACATLESFDLSFIVLRESVALTSKLVNHLNHFKLNVFFLCHAMLIIHIS